MSNNGKIYSEHINPSLLTFRNSQFLLRPIGDHDLQTLFSWRSDPKVNKYLYAPPPKDMGEQTQWYEKYLSDPASLHFMALKRGNESVEIGYSQLFKIDTEKKTAEYGIVIGNDEYLGKGAGAKLTVTFVKIAFFFLGFQALFAHVNPENKAIHRIVIDLLGSKMVRGPYVQKKGNESLIIIEKSAFESVEKKLFNRNQKWKDILNIEQVELSIQ